MQEAKEAAKRKIKQIELDKKEAARRNSSSKVGYPGYSSIASGSSAGRVTDPVPFTTAAVASVSAPAIQTTVRAGKGMKLGGISRKPII